MAMYRIKPADQEPTYPPEEYWRETKPEYQRDLDFAEIAQINRHAADDPEPTSEEAPGAKPIAKWRLVVGLLVAVAVLCFTVATIWGSAVDFSFLKRSAQLAADQSLADLRAAVVVVECGNSSGTGFNISADGLIVTNAHVVDGGGIVSVRFSEGQKKLFTSRDYTLFPEVDLALIRINGESLPTVRLSASYPAAGEDIIFIGNPLGYDWTISEGVIEGTLLLDEIPVLSFSGAVHSGSSGSPVFNQQSEVVAIIFGSLAGEENNGLAIPVHYLIEIISGNN